VACVAAGVVHVGRSDAHPISSSDRTVARVRILVIVVVFAVGTVVAQMVHSQHWPYDWQKLPLTGPQQVLL
jgi:hypothetical protein